MPNKRRRPDFGRRSVIEMYVCALSSCPLPFAKGRPAEEEAGGIFYSKDTPHLHGEGRVPFPFIFARLSYHRAESTTKQPTHFIQYVPSYITLLTNAFAVTILSNTFPRFSRTE